jgi:hypothetical protein
VDVVGCLKAVSKIQTIWFLMTMPFHFNMENSITVNDGTFNDVGRDMNVSKYRQTDSHDVEVNLDNVSSRTYCNIAGASILSSICTFQERIL